MCPKSDLHVTDLSSYSVVAQKLRREKLDAFSLCINNQVSYKLEDIFKKKKKNCYRSELNIEHLMSNFQLLVSI